MHFLERLKNDTEGEQVAIKTTENLGKKSLVKKKTVHEHNKCYNEQNQGGHQALEIGAMLTPIRSHYVVNYPLVLHYSPS